MPAPYSLDLCWRIIELHFVENKTKRSMARHLRISVLTVHRILQRFAEYGHVHPTRIDKARHYHVVNKSTASCAHGIHFKQSY